MEKEIKTKSQRIFIDEEGVIHCINLKIDRHTLEHAKENLEAISKLAGEKKCPVLVDIRDIQKIDAGARKFYSGPEYAQVQSAAALLIGSSLTRMIANFFMGLNKPLFPTRMFNDEAEAINWLKEHK